MKGHKISELKPNNSEKVEKLAQIIDQEFIKWSQTGDENFINFAYKLAVYIENRDK